MVVAIALLQFTGPTGARIDINPDSVDSVRDTSAATAGHFGKGVNCLIVMHSGKPISVREPCDKVRQFINGPCVRVCGGKRG